MSLEPAIAHHVAGTDECGSTADCPIVRSIDQLARRAGRTDDAPASLTMQNVAGLPEPSAV